MFVLLEIGDKVGSPFALVAAGTLFAALGFGLSRLRWWLALILVPILVLWNLALLGEWQEPMYGQLLAEELGYGRLAIELLAINTPAGIACWAIAQSRKHQLSSRRERLLLCKTCEYPVDGIVRCPECGRDVTAPERIVQDRFA